MIPSLETRGWWWNDEEDEEGAKEAKEEEEEATVAAFADEGGEEEEIAASPFPPLLFSFSISLAPSLAAIPKSANLTTPEALTKTFAALTSR